jgi:hypothetical protein
MSSGTLVTSPITATPPVTLSLAFFGPLTGAADTATIAQITFDAMAPLAITLQNGAITFDGITSTDIAAGQWHVVHVTYESARISWIIEGTSSGGNATIHPGNFTSVQLSVGLISTASLSVDIDNVVLTMP